MSETSVGTTAAPAGALVLSPALFAYMQSGLNAAWSAAAAEGS